MHEIADAGERTTANGALGDETKPAFRLIEPGGISWRVVHVIARPLCQAGGNIGMFVGGIVIDDEVGIVGWRKALVEVA